MTSTGAILKTGFFRRWITRLFLILCLSALLFGAAVLAQRFDLMTPLQAIVLCCGLFAFGLVLIAQFEISRDVKALKRNALDLAEYENSIKRQIESLSQQSSRDTINLGNALQSETDLLKAEIASLKNEIQERGSINTIENGQALKAPPVSSSGMPIASIDPLEKAKEEADQRSKPNTINLKKALGTNSLNMHLQPIVDFENRQPVYFDAFMRLSTSDTEYLEQHAFNKLADEGRLMPMIDKKILFSSMRMLRTLTSLRKKAGIICPLSPRTLSNKKHFDEILNYLSANRGFRSSVVMDIRQRDLIALNAKERERLAQIVDLGFALCMSHTLDLQIDGENLAQNGFRFVKVPASILVHANISEDDAGLKPTTMSNVLADHKIRVIATEVERENDAVALIDFEVPLGQGLLFAPPRPVKGNLLNAEDKVAS